ncbi:hypothetical protein [Candidatus Solirubrobacter pratensis]|uniref:hypothetical protein n=1 Tax=Candidatus Solirubrobacter pratensis TaxID=1298857 RepID=UPI00047F24BF|nr:hypothetical protein [Candidatus Solirubrobacter pratensis]
MDVLRHFVDTAQGLMLVQDDVYGMRAATPLEKEMRAEIERLRSEPQRSHASEDVHLALAVEHMVKTIESLGAVVVSSETSFEQRVTTIAYVVAKMYDPGYEVVVQERDG